MTEYVPRLKRLYSDSLRESLRKEFDYSNDMMIPRLEKIVLNMGVGEAVKDSKKAKSAVDDLTLIAGQKAVPTVARKSIAAFRLREGMTIGAKVTLRGNRMFDFLDRLITIAMPRVRDFRGVSGKSFDGNGNFAMGLKEHIVFPEIDYDAVDEIRGLDVVICHDRPVGQGGQEPADRFQPAFQQLDLEENANGKEGYGATRTGSAGDLSSGTRRCAVR